jgi:glucose/arabinose dehydrogenase/mono/diheme cytochrome c family protein
MTLARKQAPPRSGQPSEKLSLGRILGLETKVRRDRSPHALRACKKLGQPYPRRMNPFRPTPRRLKLTCVRACLLFLGLVHAGLTFAQVDPATEADHARIIQSWNSESFERGRKLYDAICITCHGNLTQPGSLPTSRPFWLEPFKNGADPFSIYKTLTTGFGQMPAWPWLTPELRYDVIHYLREEFVKPHNPDAYFTLTDEYLAGLPKGQGFVRTRETEEFERGPKWQRMQFGPALFWTLEVAPGNIAQKGIAIRLDPGPGGISRGNVWLVYDHDTMRAAAAWSGDDFVDWRGIAFDGSHGTHTSIVGEKLFVNPVGPGWANPGTRDFADNRPLDKEGRPYGPLARDWAHYQGTYVNGDRVVIDYSVGGVRVLESPGLEQARNPLVISRTFNIASRERELLVRLAPMDTLVALAGDSSGELITEAGFHVLRIAAGPEEARVKVLLARNENDQTASALPVMAMVSAGAPDLRKWMQGGPPRWPGEVVVQGETRDDGGPFAVDVIPVPNMGDNPWNAWLRPGGFDFFPDGRTAALCTWNGDVWLVKGVDGDLQNVRWKRMAAGLFQPLGLKIVDGVIHVTCRDQIARLHDLNGDEEIDWIESFNSDHQVTEHFHEFAMGLQTDAAGNFYYSKAARHAKTDLIPQHGTLLKVSRDGATTEILANGFRAPNGVCVNPDGTFFVTDQEGHWIPKNRINRIRPGGFYGNMWSYGAPASESDAAMEEPLVWVTNEMDRSPAELLWVTSDAWGPLKGSLLNLSYGTGDIFIVPHETVNGRMQGGVMRLPLERFPTGVMRGRWHPVNGQLYAAGMFAWAGNQQEDGGFYRVRLTGRPLNVPTALHARRGAYTITFSDPLDRAAATDPGNFTVKAWDLLRSKNYGSRHLNERPLPVTAAALSADGRTVTLTLRDLTPTRGMEIICRLRGADGAEFERRIHNTIHTLAEE